MRAILLGTGSSQGCPVIGCRCPVCASSNPKDKRLRSSVHLEIDSKSFVIDSGPDFRQQMLCHAIDRLDAVLFTHNHKDHTAGLDDVRAFNYKQNKSMPLYAAPLVLEQLKMEYFYAFPSRPHAGGLPRLRLCEIGEAPFQVCGVVFTPLPATHFDISVLGFRVDGFGYLTDVNYIPLATLEKMRGLRVLVLDALRREKHVGHFNLDEAIAIARRIGAEKTYLTHISHKMGLVDEVSAMLPPGVELGYDGLAFTLD